MGWNACAGTNNKTGRAGAIHRKQRLASLLIASTVLGGAGLFIPAVAHAQQQGASQSLNFNIPAQPLSSAIAAFIRTTGWDIGYTSQAVAGKRSAPVKGAMTPAQALQNLLAGIGVSAQISGPSTAALVANSAGSDGEIAGDGSLVLDTITVEGENSRAFDNSIIAARNSSAATKLNTPLIETPRAVSVITRKEMEQRSVQDIVEAVRYSAGVTTGMSGFDPRFDQIYIRGYSATTMGDYKDGLRQPYLNYGMFRTDPYSLERVEVVKGPVSVLYGAGTPAGIVNKASKFADGRRIREVEALYGTKSRTQFAFDIGDTFGEGSAFAYRLVGLARAGDTNFDVADDRYFLQPSITWTPSDKTRLTVYGLVQSTESDASVGAITDSNGRLHRLRASDPDYDHQKTDQQQVGYEFEHKFSDLVTFKQNLRYSHLDLRSRYLSVSSWTGTVAHRYPWSIRDQMDVFQVDNQLEWKFNTGPLSHTLLTGLDYTNVNSSFAYGYGAVDSVFDFDIANPVYGVSGPIAGYDYSQSDADLRQTGLYAIDQINIDNWHFTLGGRRTWVEQSRTGSYPSLGIPIDEELTKDSYTVQAGILYAFENGVSPYVSYATSFEPTTNRSVTGGILNPLQGRQFELGVKYQPPGSDILLSATGYHLVEKNKPVVVDAVASTYRSLGEVTNKGIELEARANVTDGWDLIAAYAYVHSRITAGSDVGNTPPMVPKHAASLWTNYTFSDGSTLSGLSAGAGFRYVGSTFISTDNTEKNKASFYLDAALSYNFGAIDKKYDGLVAALNVRNIADQRNTVCEGGYCYLGQGRNLTVSLKYRW